METLSREYGWTPSEIRSQDYLTLQSYWQIIAARRKIEEAQTKKLRKQ